MPVFVFNNYYCSIWIFLYVLAPQVLTYLRIPILLDKNNTISSPHGFRGRSKSVAVYGQEAQKAEGSISLICFHYITGGAGNSCFFVLGVPNARKGKKKRKKKSTLNSVPTFGSPPFSFFPHTQDHTLALAPPGMRVCLPTQRRLPISSQFWLSFKEKCSKRNPRSSVVQPHLLPQSMATLSCTQAVERSAFFLVGKVANEFYRKQLEASHCC